MLAVADAPCRIAARFKVDIRTIADERGRDIGAAFDWIGRAEAVCGGKRGDCRYIADELRGGERKDCGAKDEENSIELHG